MLLVSLFFPALAAEMRIHLIDVGQGAATLVEFPCGAMLIDTGGEDGPEATFHSNAALEAYLAAFFARRTDLHGTLDLLLLTHPHLDHVRGAPQVLTATRPRNIVDDGLVPKQADALVAMEAVRAFVKDTGAGYLAVSTSEFPSNGRSLTNDVLDPFRTCQGVNPSVSALWGSVAADPGWGDDPGGKPEFADENNHSVVTRVAFGKTSLLVTGDLEVPGIQAMLAARRPAFLDADILEVGHHGSYNGTTAELLAAVSPEWALIGVGPADRHGDWTGYQHGHPREATISLLQAAVSGRREPMTRQIATGQRTFVEREIGEAIYTTGWDGTVVLVADQRGLIARGTPDWAPGPPIP